MNFSSDSFVQSAHNLSMIAQMSAILLREKASMLQAQETMVDAKEHLMMFKSTNLAWNAASCAYEPFVGDAEAIKMQENMFHALTVEAKEAATKARNNYETVQKQAVLTAKIARNGSKLLLQENTLARFMATIVVHDSGTR